MTVQEFAKEFDTHEKQNDWNDYSVWLVYNKSDAGKKIGLPFYVLEKGGKYRFAEKPKETFGIIDFYILTMKKILHKRNSK